MTAASPSSVSSEPSPALSPPADARVADIVAAIDTQDYPLALKHCREARAKGLPLPLILEQEAAIYKATGYLDKELETLIAWSKAAPKDAKPWFRRFSITLDMGWRKEAEQASAQALLLAPNNAHSHVTRALLHYRSNEPAHGLPDIRRAQQLAPDNREYVSLQAAMLMKAHKAPEAEAVLRKLIERFPQEPQYRLTLAQVLARNGKAAEAEALLRVLHSEMPESAEVSYEAGLLAEKRGDITEAALLFEKAAKLDPGHDNVLFCLGRVEIKQGRATEGRTLQRRFQTMDSHTTNFEITLNRLRTRPDDPELHRKLAQVYLADKEFPQAILELRRVLELRPGNMQARGELVTALNKHGRITEARQLAQTTSPQ